MLSQDHKAAGDGDTGPNTGGMGTYSPAPVVTDAVSRQTMDEIMWRTARAMVAEGAPFKGTLFAGLMIKDGKVEVFSFLIPHRGFSGKGSPSLFHVCSVCELSMFYSLASISSEIMRSCSPPPPARPSSWSTTCGSVTPSARA